MRDRKRKIPDRKSAVFDLAKSFSFREQKLSCVRSKNRLGFSCEVSGMPTAEVQTYQGIDYPGIPVHVASSYEDVYKEKSVYLRSCVQ